MMLTATPGAPLAVRHAVGGRRRLQARGLVGRARRRAVPDQTGVRPDVDRTEPLKLATEEQAACPERLPAKADDSPLKTGSAS